MFPSLILATNSFGAMDDTNAGTLKQARQICAPGLPRRDIKTQNVFVSSGGLLKLGDFGVSKVLNSTWQVRMASAVRWSGAHLDSLNA